MSSKILAITGIIAAIIIVIMSCTGTSRTWPTSPTTTPEDTLGVDPPDISTLDAGRYMWAYYLVKVDPEEDSVELVPLREVGAHWNVLKFLEQGPCTNCISITGVTSLPSGNKEFTVEITHPFSNANLTGFDVRGIAMFAGGQTFPTSGLTTGSGSTGELANADGYTTLYSSSTMGSGPGGLEGYLDGKFSSATQPNASLNGYKRHITSAPGNTRNAFYAGDSITIAYEIKMPSTAFVFGYAVDASWAPPITNPVTDPMSHFPPEANCFEPWKIEVTKTPMGAGLTDVGGMMLLTIDVYDWQGMGSHHAPIVECSDLYNGTVTAYTIGDFGDYSRWGAEISNLKLAPLGNYQCLVSVEDVENSISPSWLDLTAYQVVTVTVTNADSGWAQTWGGTNEDAARSVGVDDAGNVYVTGSFGDTVDFDPGPATDNHTSNTPLFHDVCLSKFDSGGNFQWARTWGGHYMDFGMDLAVDSLGTVYIVGAFVGTVDFDPGAGTQNRTSNGLYDAFLLKLNSAGEYQWVLTWGGSQNDLASSISRNGMGDLFVGGAFEGSCDFDPGPGSSLYTSNGLKDAYCAMYDYLSGLFFAATCWGGTGNDACSAVNASGSSFVYAVGSYQGTVDFDPGALIDNHTSNGGSDCYLSQLNITSGSWLWSRTWGGALDDTCTAVTAISSGDAFVAGYFSSTVDFDPGAGAFSRVSNGSEDAFLSLFSPSGTLVDAKVWGGTDSDEASGVDVDETNSRLFVTGTFRSSVDFDPGSGTDTRNSAGMSDIFLSRFDTSLNWNLVRTLGGTSHDLALGITVHNFTGNVYITGAYAGTVDFDPTAGIDNHTSNGATDLFVARYSPDGSW